MTRKQLAVLWCALNANYKPFTYRAEKLIEREIGTAYMLTWWRKIGNFTDIPKELSKLEQSMARGAK